MKTNHIKTLFFCILIALCNINAQNYLTDESSGVLPNYSIRLLQSDFNSNQELFAYNKEFSEKSILQTKQIFEKSISDLELLLIAKQTKKYADKYLAKINLNLPVQEETQKSSSIFSSEVFYFVTAAVLAGAGYLIWKESSSSEETKSKTFGLPPKP